MNDIQLTDEQKAIIARVHGDFVVIASAGSGKTTVLTERYHHLVTDHHVRPSQILTITFTKKAAAEMKRRIVDRLRFSEKFSEAQEAETGPIQTLHSFYERVLRENSPEAGLDPRFEVVSGGEAAWQKRDCIKRAMSFAEEDNDESTFVLRQMAGKAERGAQSSYDALISLVDQVVNFFRDSGHPRATLNRLYSNETDFLKESDEELRLLIPAVARPPFGASNWQKDAWDDLKKENLHTDFLWLKEKISPEQARLGARYTVGVAKIALMAWGLLDDTHRKAQQLDFSALESRCVRLVETNSVVRDRLNRQYRHLMVDEAQDLNPNQIRLIQLLQPESKMLVGDDKQSIYLFRNAVGDFLAGRSEDEVMRLTKSHRSKPPIQEFIDVVFAPKMAERYQAMTNVGSQLFDDAPWQPSPIHTEILMLGGEQAWHEVAKRVQQLHDEGVKYSDIAILTKSHPAGQAVARYLRRQGIGVREGAGKSNYYAKLEVRDVCNTLLALAQHDNRFALLACLRSPVCELSLDAIVQIGVLEENPLDYEPHSDSDKTKFDRFKNWFLPMREHVDRLPAWEVISGIMAESDLLTNLASRPERRNRIENVRKLLIMAAQKPELSALEYAELIKDIERLSDTQVDHSIVDSDEDLVTTSTIHSAKGLEWPVVIIPDAVSHAPNAVRAPVFDSKTGWLGYWQGGNTMFCTQYLREKQKHDIQAELIRLQYVALTRAKDKLIVVGWESKRTGLLDAIRSGLGTSGFNGIINRVTE